MKDDGKTAILEAEYVKKTIDSLNIIDDYFFVLAFTGVINV